MNITISRTKKWMVIGSLVCGWLGFAILVIFYALPKIREFYGWGNYLVVVLPTNNPYPPQIAIASTVTLAATPEPINNIRPTDIPIRFFSPTPSIAATSVLQIQNTPTSANYGAIITPTDSKIHANLISQMFSTNAKPPSTEQPQVISYPHNCSQSLQTRFVPNQNGTVIVRIRFRVSPYDANGTLLAEGTRFRTIGAPICAIPQSYSADMLQWPVEILSGRLSGQIGWIAESGTRSSAQILEYNVEPD